LALVGRGAGLAVPGHIALFRPTAA
jgi:hypothetical protein